PPPTTTRHDVNGTGGSASDGRRAARTPSVAMRTAWPTSRLMATATASANPVQAGALQPKPAFALRHQSVRYARHAIVVSQPAARGARAAASETTNVTAVTAIKKRTTR